MTQPGHEPLAAETRPAHSSAIVQATKSYLEMHRAPIRSAAREGRGGLALAAKTTTMFDGLLSAFFCAARVQSGLFEGAHTLALLAVGSYGRGNLALGSDLDVIVLSDTPDDPRVTALVELLLYPLWDAGVSVGHSVRSPAELLKLAREDVRTATTILDARVVAGDAVYANDALERGWRALHDGAVNTLFDAMSLEMQARHDRYGASVYLLEPDVKHGRGALRDLDIVSWTLGARYRVRSFREALQKGFLTQSETQRLEDARDFYWRIRFSMHALNGRRADRLTFDAQEDCARVLGLVGDDSDEALTQGAEQLMQEYYRHARTVATLLELVLERCRTQTRTANDRLLRPERLADGLERFDNTIALSDSSALERQPSVALRSIDLALAMGLPLSSRTREMISHATSDPAWCESLRADPEAGALFVRLLQHAPRASLRLRGSAVSATEQGRGSVLAEIHDLGLLLALIPEFAPVTGRVHHDVYHVYTVDVHSVASVDRLHEMTRGEHAPPFAIAARTQALLPRRDLLALATLLHDVGKGRGGDHSAVGATLARTICERLGLSAEDGLEVSWLIRQHLHLYHVATRRDLSDPVTIQAVASVMERAWRLRALYLLTVADLSTTSPTSMTSWKASMLDELLQRVDGVLSGQDAAVTESALRERAMSTAGADQALVTELIDSMPPRYLQATRPDAIARHARSVLGDRPANQPLVHIFPIERERDDLLEIVIAAEDQPGLLARWTGALVSARLDVQSAQLYCRQAGALREAVDVFIVRRLDDDPGGVARLQETLPGAIARSIGGPVTRPSIRPPGFRRAEPSIRTEVLVDHSASSEHTVIEVFARDRPGLLHAIADALYRLEVSIASAKVSTEGRRAADVFYVTDALSQKLDDALSTRVVAALKDVLDPATA
ncbi:MAG: [protein-PII] uridylyltransferase [Deltaproteobacteria bacterium]|nr:[protein-PII] uridylyltransferase [Deltaproteobacteria bacterium]